MPDLAVLPSELQQRLMSEMRAGERIIWNGQPRKGPVVWPTLAMVAFGAFFGGFPLTGFVLPAFFNDGDGLPLSFGLFALPFVLIGLIMVLSPIWFWRRAVRTVYAVTNQQALILTPSGLSAWIVESFLPDRLTAMTRTERADGSGNLIFERFTERAGSGSRTIRRGFVGIEQVREVELLIIRTLVDGRVRPVA